MAIVRASSKYQIAIPKRIRAKLGIKAGQRLSISERDGGIFLEPLPDDPVRFLRGILKDKPSMTRELLEERARDLEHE